MRKFDGNEIALLRQTNNVAPVSFTEEELSALAEGNATFRCFKEADKRLSHIKGQMRQAISREEAFKTFVPYQQINAWIASDFNRKQLELGFLIDVIIDALKDNAMLTDEDLNAAKARVKERMEAAAKAQKADLSEQPMNGPQESAKVE
jgi:hypothetical protein